MSEPQSPESFESSAEEKVAAAARPTLRKRYIRLPERRGRRWVLGAAVALVLGVGVVGAAAVAAHHSGRERPPIAPFAMREPGAPGAPNAWGSDYGKHRNGEQKGDGKAAHRGAQGDGKAQPGSGKAQPGGRAAKLAPAALPAVPADQAVAKAAGAVPGGKVDALSVVGREGGGSSWAVEVLGTDGVRHQVVVDGTDGSITANTVVNGR
ncbi:PepSY domain-containing protein [Kitasatospora sp. NPDC004614]|uniref:PepSY domain-containing protein n=1 Tax=unclassified Kitasatospora TaxID=2633591 RepID=UPI00369E4FBF